jgi:hypothetical protein
VMLRRLNLEKAVGHRDVGAGSRPRFSWGSPANHRGETPLLQKSNSCMAPAITPLPKNCGKGPLPMILDNAQVLGRTLLVGKNEAPG